MYRAALVQNTSEMLRYGWADIRPSLESVPQCAWDAFTGDDMDELFRRLERGLYDGVVLATNACNDSRVREALTARSELVERFLVERGGGLFVSFQGRLMNTDTYGFLPAGLDVSLLKRSESGTDGTIDSEPLSTRHHLLRFPAQVSLEEVKRHCLDNEFARNLYIGYLAPHEPANYDVVFRDPSYGGVPRSLMLSSRSDLPGRVVISALPLDWQGHDALLANVVTHVVQGIPAVAVLEKKATPSFDVRYLIANLSLNKFAFARYSQAELRFAALPLDLHRFLLLDPAWDFEDVLKSDLDETHAVLGSGSKVYYFDSLESGDPIVSAIGGVRNFDLAARNALVWLVSKFANGGWEGSFWTTVDVLETLQYFKYPTDAFAPDVLGFVTPHDLGGSYDEVLVATCALLRVYRWFLGDADERYKHTREWIEARYRSAPPYELATVIDTLIEMGEVVPEEVLTRFRDEVGESGTGEPNEFRLYRYAKTLHTCGMREEAQTALRSLVRLQSTDGRWVNLPHTASVLALLLEATSHIRDAELEDATFRGIVYVKENYEPASASWQNDVLATAKSLRALSAFEEKISFPIDELLVSLRASQEQSEGFAALQIAADLNQRLLGERARLVESASSTALDHKKALEQATVQLDDARRHERVMLLLALVVTPLVAFGVLLFAYGLQRNAGSVGHFFGAFVSDWTAAVFTAVPIGPVVVVYLLIARPAIRRWKEARSAGRTEP